MPTVSAHLQPRQTSRIAAVPMLTKILDKLWDFFSSLKPLAFIFTALVLSTLFGSFIIQKPIAEEGQIERAYSPEVYKVLDFFGCFDLFHSPWFVFLIFLLGVNVLCASIEMAPRHWKLFRHIDPQLSLDALRHQRFFKEITLPESQTREALQSKITAALTRIFSRPQILEGDRQALRFFVNKMRWSYLGVYIVHAGLIVIMIGGVWGSVGGFEGQMSLMEGQQSNKVSMRNKVRRNKILDFSILCHDIRLETHDDGSPKAYFSDLEVLQDGKSMLRKTIRVNDPLVYGGIAFYQANYGKQKVNVQKFYKITKTNLKTQEQQSFQVPEDESEFLVPGTQKTIQVTHYQENPVMPTNEGPVALGETLRLSYGDQNKKEFVTLFKDYPEVDRNLRPKTSEVFSFQGLQENFELKEVTGLQVARDPGAPVVFVGCAFLVIGIFWAFFTGHQKVWVVTDGEKIYVAGKTYRSPVAFQQKFEKLVNELQIPPSPPY